jgi:hypothetical protein
MSDRTLTQKKTAVPTRASVHSGILQRKCACGNHTVAGGECAECAKAKNNLIHQASNHSAPGANFSLRGMPVIQRKLTVGASNDPLEQEADWVADKVMAAAAHSADSGTPPRIQRYAGQATESTDTVPASVDQTLASLGNPLEQTLRQDMEQRFGHDFSRVRVHSGTAAEQSARDVNANAYTVGHNIVFGAGLFTPATHEGRRLLAHELTHVVQQSGADGIHAGQGNGPGVLSPVSPSISSVTPVLRRQPAPSSSLEQSASRVLANCDVLGGSKERKCNIDNLSKAIIGALSSSPRAYVSISGRMSPRFSDDPAGEAFRRADIMRQALIQWIGRNKFADARFEAGVIEGAEGEPQVEIRIAYRPQVLSDPRTPLPPRPTDPPLPFSPPPKQEGLPGVPPPPSGPAREDPKSAEEKQKEWDTTIITEPKKTAEEQDKKTLEDAGTAILDVIQNLPEVKNLMTEKLDPIVDKLSAVVPLASIPALVSVYVGLRKTREEFPVPKSPPIKLSTGKFALGMDTRVQFTFRGPVDKPTEIAASFTLLRSAHPSKLPEGAEINVVLTAKFPDSGKAIGVDNPAASQSTVFTLTIPLPGDPKTKK